MLKIKHIEKLRQQQFNVFFSRISCRITKSDCLYDSIFGCLRQQKTTKLWV